MTFQKKEIQYKALRKADISNNTKCLSNLPCAGFGRWHCNMWKGENKDGHKRVVFAIVLPSPYYDDLLEYVQSKRGVKVKTLFFSRGSKFAIALGGKKRKSIYKYSVCIIRYHKIFQKLFSIVRLRLGDKFVFFLLKLPDAIFCRRDS